MSDEIFLDGARYVSALDAARWAGLSRDYVTRLCKRGEVHGRLFGKSWYVEHKSFQDFLVRREFEKTKSREELSRIREREYARGSVLSLSSTRAEKIQRPVREFDVQSALLASLHKHAIRASAKTPHVAFHAPFYTVTPLLDAFHKAVALITAFMLTFGTYAFVDPSYAREVGGVLARAGSSVLTFDTPVHMSNVQDIIARAVDNPSSVLAAAGGAESGVQTSFAKIAANFNRTVNEVVYRVAFPATIFPEHNAQSVVTLAITEKPVRAPASSGDVPIQSPVVRVVERIVEPQLFASAGVTETFVRSSISELEARVSARFNSLSSANSSYVTSNSNAMWILSRNTENIDDSNITNSDITGGTITDAAIEALSLEVTGTATSTFAAGINLTSGCFAVNGTCISGGSGSGTPGGSALQVQFNNYGSFDGDSDFTFSTSTNSLFVTNATTTRIDALEYVAVGSSATTTIYGSATSTFGAGVQTTYLNVTGTSATSTFANGIRLSGGCVEINGACLGVGSGASFSYPFPSNATTSLLTFSGGLMSLASTTIGNGTQAGGLVISGGATTTGNAYFEGNIGIGASDPLETLFAQKSINNSRGVRYTLSNTNTTGQSYAGAILYAANQTVASQFYADGLGTGPLGTPGFYVGNFSNHPIGFFTNNTEKARLSADGNLGIGTTSPYAKLSVAGQVVGQYFTATSSTASVFPYASTTALTVSGTNGLQLTSGLNGPLQANGGLVSATTSVGAVYGGTGIISYTTGDILYASAANTLAKLAIGSTGQVLKVSGGIPSWGADATSGGSSGLFATTSDSLAVYPTDTSDVLLLGTSATSTTGNILEILGNSLFRGLLTAYNTITAPTFTATSTSIASTFPYASTTAISGTTAQFTTSSSTNLTVSSVPSALLLTNSSGTAGAYSGTSCTNQFVRSINGAGVATCASVQDEDLNLSDITLSDFTNDADFVKWANATSSLWRSAGLISSASSTIGNGTQAGGLTISGSATTTGNFLVQGTASTSALVASTAFTFSNVTGFLKATAGAVATAAIDLASDVTGILPVANGGTGWANIAANTLLTGNGTGAVATTTIGNGLSLSGGVLATSFGTTTANTWAALQTFSSGASTTQVSVSEKLYVNGSSSDTPLSGAQFVGASGWWGIRHDSNSRFNIDFNNNGTPAALFSMDQLGFLGVGTSSQFGTGLLLQPNYQATTLLDVLKSDGTSKLSVSGSGFGTTTVSGLNINGSATSTSNVGFNLTGGCFAVNGACVGGGGSGTVGSGTTGQFPYYAANGTTLTATSSVFLATSGNVGIGTTNPSGKLDIQTSASGNQALLTLSSSNIWSSYPGTGNQAGIQWKDSSGVVGSIGVSYNVLSDTTDITFGSLYNGGYPTAWTNPAMVLKGNGNLGIGTTSPYAKLSVAGQAVAEYFTATSTTATSTFAAGLQATALNITSTSASSTFANGIVLTGGCVSVNGACLSAGGSSFSYPFPSNATTSLLTFSGGLLSLASTTIGNGTQAGGLTISGSATTTGNFLVQGTASTSALVASTAFTFSNVTGFLKATAGAVATAAIDLASDVTGILPVANGGTGWANIAANTLLTGNGTGAVATTTIGNGLSLSGGVLATSFGTTTANTWTALQSFTSGASTTLLSIFDTAYFGGTSTTTISSNGTINVPGIASGYQIGGSNALYASTTNNSVVVGPGSGASLLTQAGATRNSVFGSGSLTGASVSGDRNNVFGSAALLALTSGSKNQAIGVGALTSLTEGWDNVAIGDDAGYYNVTGSANLYIGQSSGRGSSGQSNSGNVGLGYRSLYGITTGGTNTTLGYQAGYTITSGSNNVILGYGGTSGGVTSGSNNVLIGYDVQSGLSSSGSNQLNIGNLLFGSGLGSGTTMGTGNIGVGTSSPYSKLSVWGNASGNIFEAITSASTSAFTVSGSGFGTTTVSGLTVSGSATSTSNVGWNLTGGCYAINGTCLGGGASLSGTTGQFAYFSGTNTAVGTSTLFLSTGSNVGIGTSSPYAKLTVWGAGTGTGTLFELANSASTTIAKFLDNGTGYFLGNIGIGTTTPYAKLSLTDAVSTAQVAIAYDATRYTNLLTNSVGDLVINPQGDDAFLNDDNFWVCTGGSCPSGNPTGTGNLVVENKQGIGTTTPDSKLSIETQDATTDFLRIASTTNQNLLVFNKSGFLGIGTSTPTQQLSIAQKLFVANGTPASSGTATSTFLGDVLITGKLDVSTIDPVYTIDGVKYATYGHSTVGVKEELAMLVEAEAKTATGKYEYVIDFKKLPLGSDPWLFWQVSDFGADWKNLVVSLTPGFDGQVSYVKDTERGVLRIIASAPGEVSLRLIADRFDAAEWPTLRPDQNDGFKGFELEGKK